MHPCKKCYGEKKCFECVTDIENLRVVPPTCECKSGYSDNGVICVECSPPCYTCNSVANNDCKECIK